ncbi:MAG: type IV secretory system conjugative DNA transfer family protein [Alphaproteobacteria bacterium]|nr:type IV secretory system conjugative DNA transfer family protein [Alphaproteobacteria bacterium]
MDRYSMLPSRRDPNFAEHYRALDWIILGCIYSALVAFLFSLIAYPLAHMIAHNFSIQSWESVKRYFVYLKSHPHYYFKSYFRWILTFFEDPFQSFAVWIPAMPLFIFMGGCILAVKTNPYYFVQLDQGDGRLADERDVKKMGLWNGMSFVLGLWNDKHLLRMNNFMSLLIIGAPDSGKTSGVVVPSILANDDKSMVINDMKGELFELTGGHRAELGPVFNVDFVRSDDPENGVFWPTWNPLSDMDLPPPSPGRQGYIGGLVYFLLGDGPTGTDPYWIKSGRAALEGLINYICDKCEQARANDYFLQRFYEEAVDEEDYEVLETYYASMDKSVAVKQALNNVQNRTMTFKNYLPIGKWDPIPEAWIGRQASFPLLMDFITKQQLDMSSELRARRDAGDPVAFKTDIWTKILSDIIEETTYFGYNRRALVEISQIAALPKSQRASVMSMALSGLAPFKNSVIRSRMASSDFGSVQMRGIKNPVTGNWEPVTFYLGCPIERMSNTVMKMFVNMYSGTLTIFDVSEGPCGPFPVLYVLDEYHNMSEFHVADAIGIGLAKHYAFLLTCQDLSQLSSAYGGELETIIGNTGAKIFMRCNNRSTAERINALMEKKTFVVFSESRDEGIGSGTSIFTPKSISYGTVGYSIISNSSIMNMPFGRQYALIQKHHNRPIKLKSPVYFKDRNMVKETKKEVPLPLPLSIYNQRNEEDKLPPPADMSVEPEYIQAKKIADREKEEMENQEENEINEADVEQTADDV